MLAKDIARQMCLRVDKGKEVTEPYIAHRCHRRTSGHKSRKKQVEESREDYQAFLAIATKYLFSKEYPKISLSHAIALGARYDDMGEDYELAKDIARQMCLKVDKGEKVTEPYIWKRCYARSNEHPKR